MILLHQQCWIQWDPPGILQTKPPWIPGSLEPCLHLLGTTGSKGMLGLEMDQEPGPPNPCPGPLAVP